MTELTSYYYGISHDVH